MLENENVYQEKESVKEHFFFKDEIYTRFEEEKNKCIRSILWTLEVILNDKKSENFIKARKSVLDSVNDFSRKTQSIVERSV